MSCVMHVQTRLISDATATATATGTGADTLSIDTTLCDTTHIPHAKHALLMIIGTTLQCITSYWIPTFLYAKHPWAIMNGGMLV